VYLPDDIQKNLRSHNIITETEVVMKEGDIFVAVDVVTNSRRKVTIPTTLLEKNKSKNNVSRRVLKG
jgi:hypothetical protein